jgi:hypothetical protein
MEWILTAVIFVVLCALVGGAIWMRRGVWSPATRFGFGIAGFIAALAATAALFMAAGVDHGIYDGMTRDQSDVYYSVMLSLGSIGMGAFGVLFFWFIFGVPGPRGTFWGSRA